MNSIEEALQLCGVEEHSLPVDQAEALDECGFVVLERALTFAQLDGLRELFEAAPPAPAARHRGEQIIVAPAG